MLKGIDVSGYQRTVDWKKAKKNDVQFAILKIIMKNGTPDKQFENNYKGCTDNDISIGVYNYSYATSVAKAGEDARKVTSIINNRRIKYNIWMDVEDDCQKNKGMLLIDMIRAYQTVIESAGYEFGVYTGLSFYNSFIKPYAKYLDCPFWIARYPSNAVIPLCNTPPETKKPTIVHPLWGWQYSSKGSVSGVGGNVDLNILYTDMLYTDTIGTGTK